MTADDKPSLDELVHHGVMGMKWGHHTVHNDAPNSGYSTEHRALDAQMFGNAGVRRINRRLNAGQSRGQAVRREHSVSLAKQAAIAVPLTAAALLALHGNSLAADVLKRAETNRGRAAAAQVLGISSKANGVDYAKRTKGAYKITTL